MKKASDFFGSAGGLAIGETVSLLMPAEGFLKLEGQTVNQADFPDLFDSIGHSYMNAIVNWENAAGIDEYHIGYDQETDGTEHIVVGGYSNSGNYYGVIWFFDSGTNDWTRHNFPNNPAPNPITYRLAHRMGTRWVAVDGSSVEPENVMYADTSDVSTGNWFIANSSPTEKMNSIDNNGTYIVAVGNNGHIWYTSNGSDWTQATSNTTEKLKYIYWDGTEFIVLGDNGVILTSPDQNTWTHSGLSGSYAINFNWIAKDNTRWVAEGQTGPNNDGVLISSLDRFETLETRIDQIDSGNRVIPNNATYTNNIWFGYLFNHFFSEGGFYASSDGLYWGIGEKRVVNDYQNIGTLGTIKTMPDGLSFHVLSQDSSRKYFFYFTFPIDTTTEFIMPKLFDDRNVQMYMRAE